MPVDTPPGAADRGTVIHGAIGDFTQALRRRACRPTRHASCSRSAGTHFAALDDYPEARAFWWPRFERIARWFARLGDAAARRHRRASHAEIRGELEIPLGERRVHAARRADRIERRADGRYAILDYKTGARAHREAGAHRPRAAADARSRDPAPGRLHGHRGRRVGRRARLCAAATAASRPASRSRSTSRTARPTARPTTRWRGSRHWRTRFADADHALSLARASDVDDALRRLRPSRAREGMVGDRRRGRRRRRRMSTPGVIPRRGAALQLEASDPAASRPGSPPMPAPARPTCWRSA